MKKATKEGLVIAGVLLLAGFGPVMFVFVPWILSQFGICTLIRGSWAPP